MKVGKRFIFQNTTKTKKGQRLVAISPDVMDVLEQHRLRQQAEAEFIGTAWPDMGLVFVSGAGTPIDPDNLRRLRNQLMDKAEVSRVKLHDLRHLHASVCIENGMDPATLADPLRHTRKSFTLDTYTHFSEEKRASSAVSILDWLAPQREAESVN